MRSTSLRMPAALVDALKEQAAQLGISQADVIFDALTAHVDHLDQLVQAELDRRKPAKDGLFIRAATSATEPMVTHGFRAYQTNINTIDKLAQQAGGVSRSVVCTAALRAHLTDPKDNHA